MRRILCLAGLMCAASVLVWAPAAAAGDVRCTGAMTGPINGNVTVPSGESCRLTNAAVSGNVTVQIGANAVVTTSTVGGNYSCNNCTYADLHGSTVNGNYLISGEKEGSFIDGSTIKGDLQIKTSSAGPEEFAIGSNVIGGNFSFNNNNGPSTFMDNAITGNLTCHNNAPPPATIGNTAKSMQGQCAP